MKLPPDMPPNERTDLALRLLEGRGESSLLLWGALMASLGEIIGVGGVESLFGRSVAHTSASYPWLLDVATRGGAIHMLTTLFATHGGAQAEQASAAVLKHFVGTLSVLIGGQVSNRILRASWDTIVDNEVPE